MMDLIASPEAWASLLTLTALELVLGIDNVLFLTIVTDRLPAHRQPLARRLGLGLALAGRLVLLGAVTWLIGLGEPVVELFGTGFSWRDLILIVGGLFLLYKATSEIHGTVEGEHGGAGAIDAAEASFAAVIAQIVALDMVFSVDSVLTAIGMTPHVEIMVVAMTVAIACMILAARPLGDFVSAHPSVKMLALAFLLLIGVVLIADGLHFHVPRGYLYFAIGFSALVQGLNLWRAKKRAAERQAAGA
jgi:predicted tellurium resistance membrane protein TerC